MVREIKENLCCVCLYKEMDSSKFSIDSLEKFYSLFDGSKFMFNNERFFCFEVLLKFFLLGKFYSMVVNLLYCMVYRMIFLIVFNFIFFNLFVFFLSLI